MMVRTMVSMLLVIIGTVCLKGQSQVYEIELHFRKGKGRLVEFYLLSGEVEQRLELINKTRIIIPTNMVSSDSLVIKHKKHKIEEWKFQLIEIEDMLLSQTWFIEIRRCKYRYKALDGEIIKVKNPPFIYIEGEGIELSLFK